MTIAPLSATGTSDGASETTSTTGSTDSWFEALARAWGKTLDDQAQKITDLATAMEGGSDSPSTVSMLTAESERMNFLATSESASVTSVGQALEAMARKQ